MNKNLVALIKYGSAVIFGAIIFFITISVRNIYTQTSIKEIYRYISDGFTIPGVIILCAGVLVFLSNQGAFMGVGYVVKHAVVMLIPFIKKKNESYQEYCEKKKAVKGYLFLFIVGGIYLILGIIFIILYYSA